jgi:hypothetical protein
MQVDVDLPARGRDRTPLYSLYNINWLDALLVSYGSHVSYVRLPKTFGRKMLSTTMEAGVPWAGRMAQRSFVPLPRTSSAPTAQPQADEPAATYDWEGQGWMGETINGTTHWVCDVTKRAQEVSRMVDHSGVRLRRDY